MNINPVSIQDQLLGRWYGKLDGDSMALEFAPDGHLACVILHEGRRQTILLTYRIEGDYLITDQPSHPREERTKVVFDRSVLTLNFQGRTVKMTR